MPANHPNWMLWFEEDPKTLPQVSVQAAAAYYRAKYGRVPNHVLAPLDWPENAPAEGLVIERKRFVLPRHLHLAYDPALVAEDQGANPNPSPQGD